MGLPPSPLPSRRRLREEVPRRVCKPRQASGHPLSVNILIRRKSVSLEAVQKLRGKASHLASTNFGRMGQAPEQTMVAFETSPRDEYRRSEVPIYEDLGQAFLLLKALLLQAPPRKLYPEVRYRA